MISLTPEVRGYLDYRVIIEDFNAINRQSQDFYMETQIGKNHEEVGGNSL